MSHAVEERSDAFRIEIDQNELDVALGAFHSLDDSEATSAQGLSLEQQADLFREYVDDVLTCLVVRKHRTDMPEKMWRGWVERTSERPCSLRELQVTLGTKRVYFWGREIGWLVSEPAGAERVTIMAPSPS